MAELINIDLGQRSRRLRVDTLVKLRWLALLGQAAALVVTYFGFRFSLPLGACFLVIVTSVGLNTGLRLRFGRTGRLEDVPAAFLLGYDILQLTALLYLTGGIQNPFSVLYLAPVMISAVSLPGKLTFLLTLLAIASVSALTFQHFPLPWFPGEQLQLPLIYKAGIWTAIVLGAGFVAIYASRVAIEARKLADALAATELVIAREQHLTQLDGLAAAAAHELGTPLATITLVVKELQRQVSSAHAYKEDPAVKEDLAVLAQEADRCRAILGKLTSLGGDNEDILNEMSLGVLIEEVALPYRDFGVKINIIANGQGAEPVCRRNPGILYGLGNLIENAIDFAASEVRVATTWDAARVAISVLDDGPGFSPEIAGRVGEPYVTTRGDRRAKTEEGSGLGLGLFIAKTLLERSGATVKTENRAPPAAGAAVTVTWPREAFERGAKKPSIPGEAAVADGQSRAAAHTF
jgi:two-component system, sensor histidine kinase RegB